MASTLADSMASLNAVAMGDRHADLVLTDSRLISVYTGEIIPDMQVAICKDRIAYVGPDASHTIGPKTATMNLNGRYVGPGFADPHLHMDQFVLPAEFARHALLRGVTSLFPDPIDIVGVAGARGFAEFRRLCTGLPIRIFHVVPGGLPVDPAFSNAMKMSASQERSATRHPDVLGMGEVFSWTRVTSRDPGTMRSIAGMLERNCIINGHTAGAGGRKLNAYVSSGIMSCHEPVSHDQTMERLRLGMWVMIREGSIRRDLSSILPDILSNHTYRDRLMFCSDGLDPLDLRDTGHIDHCVKESVKMGMNPVDAITMASRNSFDYYSMSRDLGGIAPGRLADILVFDDLESFRPDRVFVGGRLVAAGGEIVLPFHGHRVKPWTRKTVRLPGLSRDDFAVRSKRDVTANTMVMQTEIITKMGSAGLPSRDGLIHAAPDSDIWKVAAFDRAHKTGRRTVGFLENFGADIGAFASTWSFHENDLIVIGSNDGDMALAANHLIDIQGGMAVAKSGRIISSLPLQFAGIVSTLPLERVTERFEAVTRSMTDAGCRFARPHLIPLFLPFLALPSIRITSGGIIDVKRRRRVQPFD